MNAHCCKNGTRPDVTVTVARVLAQVMYWKSDFSFAFGAQAGTGRLNRVLSVRMITNNITPVFKGFYCCELLDFE